MNITRRGFMMTTVGGLTGLSLGTAALAQDGGTLRYGTVTEVTNLDPHVYGGSAWKALIGMIYSPIITYDTSGQLVPAIAASWEQPDAMTTIFTLRDDVLFHDGSKLTADDVVFSLERIRDEATGATLRSYLEAAEITKQDDKTIVVKTPTADAALLSVLGLPEAAIVSQSWVGSGVNIKAEANGTRPLHARGI